MKNSLKIIIIAVLAMPIAGNAKSIQESVVEKNDKTNIFVASVYDDKDQPCYAGGQYLGNCSRNNPYFNVFNGECYPSLQDCKKADGDLSSNQSSAGCVRCGK